MAGCGDTNSDPGSLAIHDRGEQGFSICAAAPGAQSKMWVEPLVLSPKAYQPHERAVDRGDEPGFGSERPQP